MTRLRLHHIETKLDSTQTRIKADSIFEENCITGKQFCYEELELVVKTLKNDLDNILKEGKKIYKRSN